MKHFKSFLSAAVLVLLLPALGLFLSPKRVAANPPLSPLSSKLYTLNSGAAASSPKVVRLETNMGNIRIQLSDETPKHRDNFVRLAAQGYFNGLLFHRVIKDFMIQAGDPDSRVTLDAATDTVVTSPSHDKPLGEGGPGYDLPAEFCLPWLYHVRGAVAAAREGDDVNPEQRSSGSQFYIVWGRTWGKTALARQKAALEEKGIEMTAEMWNDYLLKGGTPHLDGTYTVFGHVIDGLKVVRKIQQQPTDPADRPLADIVIKRAVVE